MILLYRTLAPRFICGSIGLSKNHQDSQWTKIAYKNQKRTVVKAKSVPTYPSVSSNHYDDVSEWNVQLAGFLLSQRNAGKSESADNWLDVALLIVLRYMVYYVCYCQLTSPFFSVFLSLFCMDSSTTTLKDPYHRSRSIKGFKRACLGNLPIIAYLDYHRNIRSLRAVPSRSCRNVSDKEKRGAVRKYVRQG